jgi:hypothetical protein
MEENSLRVYENRVMRKKIGPKEDRVTGQWRRVHNKDFHC